MSKKRAPKLQFLLIWILFLNFEMDLVYKPLSLFISSLYILAKRLPAPTWQQIPKSYAVALIARELFPLMLLLYVRTSPCSNTQYETYVLHLARTPSTRGGDAVKKHD